MNKIFLFSSFSILVAVLGFGTLAEALEPSGGTLTVSNIGSSGDDGANTTVPPWIKTSMTFWVEGHTSDAEFLSAVEFLANEKIIRVAEPTSTTGGFDTEMVSMGAQADNSTGSWQTEILSMDLAAVDSFFDIFYATYTVDSFFDVFTELQESNDSFFDVFFEVDTPGINDCPAGEELVWIDSKSTWTCASADNVDSFFDVFFDVATESSQNTEDITELERKIAELEKKIAELESSSSDTRPGY